MIKSPAACWNAGRFIGVTVRGRRPGLNGRRDNAGGASSEEESAVALRYISYWPHRIGSVGTRGLSRGVSGARRGLRHERGGEEGRKGEGEKREGERCWK